MIAYVDLECGLPVEFIQLDEIWWEEKINEHSHAIIRGVVSEEMAEQAMDKCSMNQLCYIKGAGKPLFYGLLTNIEVTHTNGFFQVECQLTSMSVSMDLQKRRRSFQNVNHSYSRTAKDIITEYKGMAVVEKGTELKPQAPLIQYDETDWAFLKRIASYLGTYLYPDVTSEKNVIVIGSQSRTSVQIESAQYQIGKDLSEYRSDCKNKKPYEESDSIYYQLESMEYYRLGDTVSYQNRELRIIEKSARLIDGRIAFQYKMKKDTGISCPKQYNDFLGGVAIKGRILSIVDGYKLKLHLEIDEKQQESEAFAYPFATRYAANGHTGWYFIPEVGEEVLLWIADRNEEDAYVAKVVQKSGELSNYTSKPGIMYTGIPSDTELMVNSDEIIMNMTDNKMYLWMSEKNGLVVHSDDSICIHADRNINISCAKMTCQAKGVINLAKGGQSILVDSVVSIKG